MLKADDLEALPPKPSRFLEPHYRAALASRIWLKQVWRHVYLSRTLRCAGS
jgi:hypothetical protein